MVNTVNKNLSSAEYRERQLGELNSCFDLSAATELTQQEKNSMALSKSCFITMR